MTGAALRSCSALKKTRVWLDQPIGQFEKAMPAREKLDAALHGSEAADLLNRVQPDLAPSDFACASLPNEPVGFGEAVSPRDVCTLCPFANVCVEKEGDQADDPAGLRALCLLFCT